MMWVCPKCERRFKTINQSHSCTSVDMGELFLGKSDDLVLAFDAICQMTADWEPTSIGTATHAIVFTSTKAWLIVKPMKSGLDVKFYNDAPIESDRFTKITSFYGKYAHHIRIKRPEEVDSQFMELIRIGFDYTLAETVHS